MEIIIQISLFLTISFWAYCNLFYQKKVLPYAQGYLIFTMIQWILLAVNLIRIYDWLIGIISFLVLLIFGAVIITNFTTNQIYKYIFRQNPLSALALFSVFVLISFGLTIAGFIL